MAIFPRKQVHDEMLMYLPFVNPSTDLLQLLHKKDQIKQHSKMATHWKCERWDPAPRLAPESQSIHWEKHTDKNCTELWIKQKHGYCTSEYKIISCEDFVLIIQMQDDVTQTTEVISHSRHIHRTSPQDGKQKPHIEILKNISKSVS